MYANIILASMDVILRAMKQITIEYDTITTIGHTFMECSSTGMYVTTWLSCLFDLMSLTFAHYTVTLCMMSNTIASLLHTM